MPAQRPAGKLQLAVAACFHEDEPWLAALREAVGQVLP